MTTIYALIDPRSSGIRYVGRTVDTEVRYRQHLSSPTSDAMRVWLAALAEEGLKPALDVLATCEDSDADAVETEWIKKLAKSGALLNTAKMRVTKIRLPAPQRDSYESTTVADEPTEKAPSADAAFFLRAEASALLSNARLPPWTWGVSIA